MMSKKKLSQIKAEVAALLPTLPGESPEAWLAREFETAKKGSGSGCSDSRNALRGAGGRGKEMAKSET